MAGIEKNRQEFKAADNKIINEEYKMWKKNSPFLYDLLVTQAFAWPSLTFQWLPNVDSAEGKDYKVHRFLCSTHTSGTEPEFLQIAEVQLPDRAAEVKGFEVEEDKRGLQRETSTDLDYRPLHIRKYLTRLWRWVFWPESIGLTFTRLLLVRAASDSDEFNASESRIKIVQRIPHEREVNRARYMPQNPDFIATKTVRGEVHVFDRTKHVIKPAEGTPSKPQIRLRGHDQEGYSMAWNPNEAGVIIDGSEDTTICLWNISGARSDYLEPERVFSGHTAFVGDVAWHANHDSIFASVGDDKLLLVWDTRGKSSDKAVQSVAAHADEVNSVAFNPASDYVLATASADKTVALWDLRNVKLKLHSLEAHHDQVLQVAWNPNCPTILGSASADRRINVWDLSRIGDEQKPDEREDGPPELLFMHGGHTERISDFSWNPNEEWVVGSSAENNIIMIWEMASHIYGSEETDPANELKMETTQ